MVGETTVLDEVRTALTEPDGHAAALGIVLRHFGGQGGTIHLLGKDGLLHLWAHSAGMPPPVLETIRAIPVGKGMAGLAFERRAPVTACNLQTDTSGDVRPGARATGLAGSICVPMLVDGKPVGALGIGTVAERDYDAAETELLLALGRVIAEHPGKP